MFPLLPPALVALILASPVLAAQTSFNDPFKALAARVVKPPDPPVCCLTPLQPTEPPPDDVLLSFEEWKEKRVAMQNLVQSKGKDNDATAGERVVDGGDTVAPAAEVPSSPPAPQDAPHFRVPITDRFNYASLDCSARVHTSHRAAKSPESILSSKRDRYMLSPCRPPKGEPQFIVVELCEDIRIDTVQLANFEFFSGVFKDFTVSVSKTYTTDPEGWTFASTHQAKNIRVVQSFHPPTSLRDFYRYIRIDFHSHYSNEYYCPISLFRVYGLTHLEEYKWDIWETESRARARREEQAPASSTPLEVNEPAPAPVPDPVLIGASYAEYIEAASTEREGEQGESPTEAATKVEPIEQPRTQTSSQSTPDVSTVPLDTRGQADPEPLPVPATSESSEALDSTTVTSLPTTTPDQIPPQTGGESSSVQQHASTISDNAVPPNESEPSSVPASDSTAATTATGVVVTASTVSTLSITSLVPAPAGGESIYRTIMNRLTALEANHTLYARYVEEHTGAVREMLRRVGEDLGRAEGVGKAQAQTYARTLLEWEQQRKRGDAEYRELMRRVEYLSDEIVLEKRLGIAQLLLLLAVLVFMSLTRGSRGEAVMVPSVNRSALRAWGRRHLSLKNLSGSGDWDWVGRLKSRSRSRSHSPKPAVPKPTDALDPSMKLEFPSVDEKLPMPPSTASKPKPPRLNLHGAVRPRSRTRSIGNNTIVFDSPRARSRTPTLMRTPHRRPATPTHAHTQNTPAHPSTRATPLPMQQSVSQGAHVPRSARRWARTAHLHELRGGATGSAQRLGVAQEAVVPRSAGAVSSVVSLNSDVFASPSPASSGPRSADLLDVRLRTSGSAGGRGELVYRGLPPSAAMLDRGQVVSAEDTGEGDLWVDTDEGSEIDGDGDADFGVESPWMDRIERVAVVA
ncbi:UNC-like C-terminal-domain-containing protein [Mycena epipterygia]|nr:UNC-like C-terminal-domain-containing protein [Mycena epipterygia]